MFSHFSRTPTCDRQIHDHGIYHAEHSLRGKNSLKITKKIYKTTRQAYICTHNHAYWNREWTTKFSFIEFVFNRGVTFLTPSFSGAKMPVLIAGRHSSSVLSGMCSGENGVSEWSVVRACCARVCSVRVIRYSTCLSCLLRLCTTTAFLSLQQIDWRTASADRLTCFRITRHCISNMPAEQLELQYQLVNGCRY